MAKITSNVYAFDYLRKSANIHAIAKEHNVSKGEVVNGILRFLKAHPESSYYTALFNRLKAELTRRFLADKLTAADFAEVYGLSEKKFIQLVSECIDEQVTTDALADKIYRRLLWGRNTLGVQTPKRVIIYMAKIYVSDQHMSQTSLAFNYNLTRQAISVLLHRGVTEGILEPKLATAVANKAAYRSSQYCHLSNRNFKY